MSIQQHVIRIISVVNQKGGVGKTTTVVNLAAVLAATGKRVLVVDIDPQGNSSTSFGIDITKRKFTIYDVLLGRVSMLKAVLNTDVPQLDLISSSIDLVAVESEFHDIPKKEIIIKEKLKDISQNYDFIFFDCPPSLGLLTINALAASDSVMIPVQCEFLALEGMAYLLNTVKLIKGSLNKNLKIEGILLTMYDKRNRLCVEVAEEVRSEFGEVVYNTIIPRNIRLSEAPSHGQPGVLYDTKSLGAIAFFHFAKEFLSKM